MDEAQIWKIRLQNIAVSFFKCRTRQHRMGIGLQEVAEPENLQNAVPIEPVEFEYGKIEKTDESDFFSKYLSTEKEQPLAFPRLMKSLA